MKGWIVPYQDEEQKKDSFLHSTFLWAFLVCEIKKEKQLSWCQEIRPLFPHFWEQKAVKFQSGSEQIVS